MTAATSALELNIPPTSTQEKTSAMVPASDPGVEHLQRPKTMLTMHFYATNL